MFADGRAERRDERWLLAVLQVAFVVLLGSSLIRYLAHDRSGSHVLWVSCLFALFGLLYFLGSLWAPAPQPGTPPARRHLLWLAVVSSCWAVLLALAPSATWCLMPVLFAGLHRLPTRIAIPVVAVLTVLVVASQLRGAGGAINPNMLLAPPAVAAVATAVLVRLKRQSARQRLLIADLVRTREALAATERRAGTLAERQRLSAEIHDVLAQGLASQQMLLQAADHLWSTSPDTARRHVRDATAIVQRGLVEARRFVRDLSPADLADYTLAEALSALTARETTPHLTVTFHEEGPATVLSPPIAGALLRIAQGAMANVREHANATQAVITLTHLEQQVSLDIADNGTGCAPEEALVSRPRVDHAPRGDRGFGLPSMHARALHAGGTLSLESVPEEGTVVTATFPIPS
ncbi:sensor histidine kinase [Streptomyces chiangmaiensis]|uniref:Sensor histidine kinase n=1 Tax=Streptomyces chiangmaiensis TaxID=766497 RepID=A0ABU7FLJ5_9ACTN|nr:sensor histidine kinase [Streptomyces chiangmaiensis]MED7823989.1 sensor histidine kinase [Streptomyces chiangmaiensis]